LIERAMMIRDGVEGPVTHRCHSSAGFPELLHPRLIQLVVKQRCPENEPCGWQIPKLLHHFTKLFRVRIRQAKVTGA
jgi:hypothetical protein